MRLTGTLATWSGESEFRYAGSLEEGFQIRCGRDFSRQYSITGPQLRDSLTAFSGQSVKIGTHRTDPPDGSIGNWLRVKYRKAGIMSYLGPILIDIGHAEHGAEPDQIKIKRFLASVDSR